MGLVSTEMTDSFIFFSSWNPCLLIYLKLDKGTSFGRSLPEKRLIGSEYPWEAIIWVALEEKACVNVSWRRLAQIKQLAWPMAERQIEHRKSCYPVVNWRSRPVAKSAYYFFNTYRQRVLEIFFLRSKNLLWPTSCPPSLILLFLKHSNTIALLLILGFQASS